MTEERLDILYVSPMPPSPPRSGAQARMHGLGKSLARSHEITALSVIDEGYDPEACARAMREYCREVTLVSDSPGGGRLGKRMGQIRSLLSTDSYERRRFSIPGLQEAIDRVQRARRFDLVFLHFPYLAHYRLRQSPPGSPPPSLVIDSHDIGYDLTRQVAHSNVALTRRAYAALAWRKLEREEKAAYEAADGVCVCSKADQARLLADAPSVRTVVIPNAADVDYFQPRASDPPPDGRTVLFFGLLSTVPNVDGVRFFLKEIWPRIAAQRPSSRCKIVGAQASAALRALAGPRIEFTGVVEDLRPHLSSAAVVVVPLRLGSGTRLKIVEAWAMGKPIVSTALGAEGIEGATEQDLLIANDPLGFAAAVGRVLDDPTLARELGRSGRRRAEESYSWAAAGVTLERFVAELLAERRDRPARVEG
jgi:polysaccharide biosynthesis protein PslH